MQREIKFRAWDTRTKYMVELQGFKYVGNKSIQLFYVDDDGCSTTCTCDKEFIVLMQYTGLNDKNSKEVWEGDVLSDDVQLWLVRHSKTMSGLTATEIVNKRLDFGSCFSLYHLVTGHNCKREVEVIGNIHENPELLEVGHAGNPKET